MHQPSNTTEVENLTAHLDKEKMKDPIQQYLDVKNQIKDKPVDQAHIAIEQSKQATVDFKTVVENMPPAIKQQMEGLMVDMTSEERKKYMDNFIKGVENNF